MAGDHEEIYRRLNSMETTVASHTAEVRTELAKLRDDVGELLRVVVRGNGDSLVTRLRIVERDVAGHGGHIARCRQGRTELDREGVRGRWSAIVAVIGAAGMVLAGIISLARALFAGGGS
jgi:hypothetical protein